MDNPNLFKDICGTTGEVLGTAGGIYTSAQTGGGIVGSVAGGSIGGKVGQYAGQKIGTALDKQCAFERSQLMKYKQDAQAQGCNKEMAEKYATMMVYPSEF